MSCIVVFFVLYSYLNYSIFFFFLMIRRPPRSTQSRSSAASDVYKRQVSTQSTGSLRQQKQHGQCNKESDCGKSLGVDTGCLLYTSDAADDLLCVDLGGRRIIKKKKKIE
eukprot:TRINITY_DN1962_c0_g1_i12.p2 TRINITY_DN1962_c0_g1~~TRINITY_DN1962_c0_g1_i12.p2  ORF type:complete len:110 (-),score=63.49 TRINITY_DN1962_c0_g1_i12:110-439(-)